MNPHPSDLSVKLEWFPVISAEKPPKPGRIYLVCGRDLDSNRPYWTRAMLLQRYYHQASKAELASEGTDNFAYSDFHDAWFWPEGWYEMSDYDNGAYPLSVSPEFYAEVDLPISLLMTRTPVAIAADHHEPLQHPVVDTSTQALHNL